MLENHFLEAIAAHYDITIGGHADAAVIDETVDVLADDPPSAILEISAWSRACATWRRQNGGPGVAARR